MKNVFLVLSLAVTTLLVTGRDASAQCTFFVVGVPDGRIIGPFTNSGASNLTVPYFQPEAGRSYSVEVVSTGSGLISAATGDPGTSCPSANGAGVTVTTGMAPKIDSRGSRVSFITSSTSFVATRIDNGTFVYSVTETTLFNSSWSTTGGYLTQWGLQNTTGATITGVLTVQESFGGSAVYTKSVTLPANSSTFVLTQDTFTGGPIPTGRAGSATFVHNGPPGSVQGDGFLINTTSGAIIPVLFRPRTAGR